MQQHAVSAPARLDAFLAELGSWKSRTAVQRFIEDGGVLVNGRKVRKCSHRLEEGDTVTFDFQAEQTATSRSDMTVEPRNLSLSVLYEDDGCIVIDKPRGLAVHPAPSTKDESTVLHGALWLLQERGLLSSAAETLVHRLDKETTGCLLLAKSSGAHRYLQKQFESRTVEKQYLALCAGRPKEARALIDAPVGRHAGDRMKMSVLQTGKSARSAQTSYDVLDATSDAALLLCTLHTGRTHQIRVHLASIGHSILGDETYASKASHELSRKKHIDVLCLHAWKLGFSSHEMGKRVEVIAPVPSSFEESVQAVGLRLAI